MDELESLRREFILKQTIKPSEKVIFLSLLLHNRPLTVHELNQLNNYHKTLQNYRDLLAEHISSGLIIEEKLKTGSGLERVHFSINTDLLDSLIESDDN